jgi:hypothetical protein
MSGQPESAGHGRADGQPRSYYGRPIVKTPPWTDEVAWYLFTGGLAGASASLALGARATGNDRLASNAIATSAAGVAVSLPLLVHDLGRPERFHHMLRMFKPTSPMNIGSWILTTLGPAAIGATVANRLGIFPRLGRVAEVAAGLLGPALSTYTGVLLADTAVPTWHSAGNELPLLFASSAAASAGGMATIVTPYEDAGPARRLAIGGVAVELATAVFMRRRLGPLAKPYRQGPARRLSLLARVSGVGGALLVGLGGRRRASSVAGGALLVASSAFRRFSVYRAGIESAEDPGYTVALQRARIASSGQEPATRR